MLTYEAGPGSKQLLKPVEWAGDKGGKTKLYDPPIDEFSVLRVELGKGEKAEHSAVDGPSIVVVTSGKGKVVWEREGVEEVSKGDVLVVGCGKAVEWEASEEEGLVLFRALVDAPEV
jgi:mannose-6-phosphate isomerase